MVRPGGLLPAAAVGCLCADRSYECFFVRFISSAELSKRSEGQRTWIEQKQSPNASLSNSSPLPLSFSSFELFCCIILFHFRVLRILSPLRCLLPGFGVRRDSRQAAIPLVAEDLPQVVVSPAGRLCLAELQAAVKATPPSNGLSPPSSSPPANAAAPPDPPQQQQHDLDAGENLADPQQQQQEKQQEVVHPEEEKLHQQPQSQAPPSTDRDEQALLIFVPVRLGLDRINPIYVSYSS